jgi:tRNA G37 N-methylase Trm5
MEKNSSIRTVVNKTSTIDTVYRFFHMELIAGEPDYIATVKESGCSFRMAYDKVQCSAVQCGAVRCGVVWCDVVWCGVVRCGAVLYCPSPPPDLM